MPKIFLEKIILVNRAPFDKPLELSFEKNEIVVLSAINGMGKTTILSYIVDAFHEIARSHFPQEYKGIEKEYYRISTKIFNMKEKEPSFVYLRFVTNDGSKIDYVDVRSDDGGNCTSEQYDTAIKIENKIPYAEFSNRLNKEKNAKYVRNFSSISVQDIFSNNVLTYFPSYRYEQPGYLNDPYKINLNFNKEFSFFGYLPNPLEVTNTLPKIMNWIMDVVIDLLPKNSQMDVTYRNLCHILSKIIHSKFDEKSEKIVASEPNPIPTFSFAVSKRNAGPKRIIVRTTTEKPNLVYPSVLTLSSGESSLLCIFGELLRQADQIKIEMKVSDIHGIVLIDEIDKHLHMKLQYEALPRLLKMFPNIQFITSCHSPFLGIGLNKIIPHRTKIIDLPSCIPISPLNDPQFNKIYDLILDQEKCFKDFATAFQNKLGEDQKNLKPMIMTEGKTDVMHLKKAMQMLGINDFNIDFVEHHKKQGGESFLKDLLKYQSLLTNEKIIVGIFDRDNNKIVEEIEANGKEYKDYGNNVYAICIPPIEGNEECSIEHYYPANILKKKTKEGWRLFTGDEFYEKTGYSKDGIYFTTRKQDLKRKIKINGIIDEDVYKKDDLEGNDNVALTKKAFATFINDIDDYSCFKDFQKTFDRLKKIPGIQKTQKI